MTRALAFAVLVGLVATAHADDDAPARAHADDAAGDDAPARAHARHSTTLYLGSMWAPGPTVPIRVGVEAALRMQRAHLAFELRLGGGGAGSVTGFGSVFGWHVGGGLGAALPLGGHVVVTPMLAYDVFGLIDADGASFPVHYMTLAVPVSLVVRRGALIELFAQAGLARYNGATDPAIVVGPRVGIAF